MLWLSQFSFSQFCLWFRELGKSYCVYNFIASLERYSLCLFVVTMYFALINKLAISFITKPRSSLQWQSVHNNSILWLKKKSRSYCNFRAFNNSIEQNKYLITETPRIMSREQILCQDPDRMKKQRNSKETSTEMYDTFGKQEE